MPNKEQAGRERNAYPLPTGVDHAQQKEVRGREGTEPIRPSGHAFTPTHMKDQAREKKAG